MYDLTKSKYCSYCHRMGHYREHCLERKMREDVAPSPAPAQDTSSTVLPPEFFNPPAPEAAPAPAPEPFHSGGGGDYGGGGSSGGWDSSPSPSPSPSPSSSDSSSSSSSSDW